jgi:hypothetical protein
LFHRVIRFQKHEVEGNAIPCVDFGMHMSKIRAKKCLKIKKAHSHLVILRKLDT